MMDRLATTCWTVVQGAAEGDGSARELFAARYEPAIRAYLRARWRDTRWGQEVDDAVQDVFAECFRSGGVLEKLEPGRPGGFRAFLFGAVRVVALRVEANRGRSKERPLDGQSDAPEIAADETRASVAFDRAWARSVLREAAERQDQNAQKAGEAAVRRVELLRLRFHDGLPIREIARKWGCEADALHRDYARARQEFKEALAAVVAEHHPGSTSGEVERQCAGLLAFFD